MKSFTELPIENMGFFKLNNAEHYTFHEQAKNIMSSNDDTVAKIFSATLIEEYAENIEKLKALINRQEYSELTPELEGKDRERDELISYMFGVIRNAINSPLKNQKDACVYLSKAIERFQGINEMPYMQETAQVDTLVQMLNEADAKAHLTALSLVDVLTALETANDEYKKLDSQRLAGSLNKRETRELRDKIDNIYKSIMLRISAVMILMPDTTAEAITVANATDVGACAKSINALIDQTTVSYNQRMAK